MPRSWWESPEGTSNKLAVGPDGISYRLIKVVRNTRLGEELVWKVASNLASGFIPLAW